MAFGKNKSNWDKLRNRKASETTKYRDVYEDQQLERGDLAKVETMTSRNILNIVITVFVFALVWFFVSIVEMLFSGDAALELSPDPSATWIFANEYYENVNDPNDKITVEEFEALKATYDPNIPVVEEPIKPDVPVDPATIYKPLADGGYVDANNTYITTDKYVSLVNDFKEYSAKYEGLVAEYDIKLEAYNAYKDAIINPNDKYMSFVSHYRNRNDYSQYITVDEYNNLVTQYQNNVVGGKFSEDELSVPKLPIDPTTIYVVHEKGSIPVLDESGRPVFNEEIGQYIMNTDQPIIYKSVLDGNKIDYVKYNELVSAYDKDIEAYLTAYHDHRVKHHPDNIDGTAKIMNLGFTPIKFMVSGGLAAILFGVLYMVLSKNLKAQNLMSDTSDINQYKGDQHIALPEEVQRNYDWFPDVGAHSAVQVSSMISHMALTNKGLKTVKLAKRADKDVVDENGDIKYFKGEILEDDNGNPITNTVPMIDEDFMEALFDASGAPNDKNVRRRYDTTKIQYNPDGSNRDKLGKYNTVADLINDDWEFPIYEPQRPGGAYIVDTAPVNTINKQYAM